MIYYRTVQVDPAAVHLLGFAKKLAQRLVEGGLRSFSRSWFVGGVEIRARCAPSGEDEVVRLSLLGGGTPFYWTYETTFNVETFSLEDAVVYVRDFNSVVVFESRTAYHSAPTILVSANGSTVTITQVVPDGAGGEDTTLEVFRRKTGRTDGVLAGAHVLPSGASPVAISGDGTRVIYTRGSGVGPASTNIYLLSITYTVDEETGVETAEFATRDLLVSGVAPFTLDTYSVVYPLAVSPDFACLYVAGSDTATRNIDVPTRIESWSTGLDIYRVDTAAGGAALVLSLPSLEGALIAPPGSGQGSSTADYSLISVTARGAFVWVTVEMYSEGLNVFLGGGKDFRRVVTVYKDGGTQETWESSGSLASDESHIQAHPGAQPVNTPFGVGGLYYNTSDDGGQFYTWEVRENTEGAPTRRLFGLGGAISETEVVLDAGVEANDGEIQELNAAFAGGFVSAIEGHSQHVEGVTVVRADDTFQTTVKAKHTSEYGTFEVTSFDITDEWTEYSFTIDAAQVPSGESRPFAITFFSEGSPFLIKSAVLTPDAAEFTNPSFDSPAPTAEAGRPQGWAAEGVDGWGAQAVCILSPHYAETVLGEEAASAEFCAYGYAFEQTVSLPNGAYSATVKLRRHPWWPPRRPQPGSESVYPMFTNRARLLWHVPTPSLSGARFRVVEYTRVPTTGAFARWELRQVSASRAVPAGIGATFLVQRVLPLSLFQP